MDDLEDERAHELLTDHLARLRKARKLTQEQLAERADLSADTIRRLESGGHSPSFRTLRKIAKGLGLPLQTLFASLEVDPALDPAIDELVTLLRAAPRFPTRLLVEFVRGLLAKTGER